MGEERAAGLDRLQGETSTQLAQAQVRRGCLEPETPRMCDVRASCVLRHACCLPMLRGSGA